MIALLVAAVIAIAGITYAVLAAGDSGSESGPAATQGPSGSAPQGTSSQATPAGSSVSASEGGTAPTQSAAKPDASSVPDTTSTPSVVRPKVQRTTQAPLDEPGDLGNGVTVSVSEVEKVKGEAQGPGEISGPALRVSVTVTNDTAKPVPMNLALANLYYGQDRTPAGELSGPGAQPLRADVPPGGSATGKYVYAIPENERKQIEVEFSYTTDAPVVIFTGSA